MIYIYIYIYKKASPLPPAPFYKHIFLGAFPGRVNCTCTGDLRWSSMYFWVLFGLTFDSFWSTLGTGAPLGRLLDQTWMF